MRLLAALVFVCASSPVFAQVKNPDTYTYLTISEPNSLDPAWAYDAASHSVILNLYEPLFAFEGSSTEKLEPRVASKVPSRANGLISADGKTYRIPIRKGIKFHDGTELTAKDVQYSLLRFMFQDREAGPATLLLEPLLGVTSSRGEGGKADEKLFAAAEKAVAVKGDEVVLTLPKPYAPLLTILALWSPVVSQSWCAKNGDWDGQAATWVKHNNPAKQTPALFEKANGSGPFMLQRWDRASRQLVLGRFDGYWRGPAKLARVVIRSVPDFNTRKLSLQAGDADSIFADRTVMTQAKGVAGAKVIDDLPTAQLDQAAYFVYKINPTGNPFIGSGKLDGNGIPPEFFSDKDVRKAFAQAFDYKGFIKDVNAGKGVQPTGAVPKGLPGYNPAQPVYAFDKAKAEAHFKKALGGKLWDTGFTFTLAYGSGNIQRETICQILKRSIESINPKFRIDVRPMEWPTFLDALRASKLPMFLQGWSADYPDPHSFAQPVMHSKGGFPKIQGYKNPQADALVEQGIAETDPAKRKQIYAKLQAIEHEDAPHILILNSASYRLQREWVQGWSHNPLWPDAPHASYYHPISKAAK